MPTFKATEAGRAAIARCREILGRVKADPTAERWDAMTDRERAWWMRCSGAADAVERGDHRLPWASINKAVREGIVDALDKAAARAGWIRGMGHA